MTTEIARGSSHTPLDRRTTSPVVRSLLGLFLVGLIVVLLAVLAAAFFALRMWAEDRAAANAVAEEVARLQAAGYPMTSDDLYRAHQTPSGTTDTTAAWLAAMKSFDPVQFNKDAKGIPYVGDGDAVLLASDTDGSQLAAAKQFLAKYDSTIQAIMAAAQQGGECRFPVKFEQGISAVPGEAQNVRTLVRLLALDVHLKAASGKADEALASLDALFAASDTLSHQRMIVEHLIRLATLSRALAQAELLLNEVELTDAQLTHLEERLAACDILGSFTRSLIGERAMGYQAFQQLFGVAPRSADCQKYLELLATLIDFSSQPLPTGRDSMQATMAARQAEQQAASTWQKSKYAATMNVLPSLTKAFDACVKAVANRDAMVTAIAAERYRLKTGQYPALVADLAPDFMTSVPVDPFDGQPLRVRAVNDGILIYSVGADGKDDGAVNPPGNSYEPDIVVRVSAIKARSP